MRAPRHLILALALGSSLLPAQTLQQAEGLWKARRYQDANTVFRDLVAHAPRDPAIRVRWGRMFLEHWQADEADRLFNEALELKPNDAGALLGKALVAAEVYAGNAAELARRALRSDPKLVEAQELLARLALEDDDRTRAEAEAKGRWTSTSIPSRLKPSWPRWIGWRTKRRAPGTRTRPKAMRPPAISSCSTGAMRNRSRSTGKPSLSIRGLTPLARSLAST